MDRKGNSPNLFGRGNRKVRAAFLPSESGRVRGKNDRARGEEAGDFLETEE